MLSKPALSQVGWFIGLWSVGVLALGLVGLLIKFMLAA